MKLPEKTTDVPVGTTSDPSVPSAAPAITEGTRQTTHAVQSVFAPGLHIDMEDFRAALKTLESLGCENPARARELLEQYVETDPGLVEAFLRYRSQTKIDLDHGRVPDDLSMFLNNLEEEFQEDQRVAKFFSDEKEIQKKLAAAPSCDDRVAETEIMNALLHTWRTGQPHNDYIEVFARALCRSYEKFPGWSHTFCHLFEHYKRGIMYYNVSLLNSTASTRGAIKMLIDELVRRCMQEQVGGCLRRIFTSVYKFNLDQVNFSEVEQFDLPFAMKPDSVHKPEFIALLNSEKAKNPSPWLEADQIMFLAAKTPREFIEKVVHGRVRFSVEPAMILKILGAAEAHLGKDEVKAYIAEVFGMAEVDLQTIKSYCEAADGKLEEADGIYVDVEGTLIQDGVLNSTLYARLMDETRRPVIIFTGGNMERLTQELRQLGVDEKFLPVRSKSAYRGRMLEVLVDDTLPELQGFRAKRLYSPRYPFF